MIDLYNRVIVFTKNIFTMNLSKVLFVTHAGVIRALLSKGLEINLEDNGERKFLIPFILV